MQWLLKKIVGTKNERDIKKLQPLVKRVNELEIEYQTLSEDALKAKTPEFKKRLEDGETVDDILCEAFAVVKSTCRRLLNESLEVSGHMLKWDMVPYDVQILGGIVLHQGKIAEMATGEGKTLVATFPVYLNALTGRGVHLVTVNDYLARRDAQWMGHVYTYLGLTVGCIQHDMDSEVRREQYQKDITYGTNSEFGFDYLRDNMCYSPEDYVQRAFHYALVDEIDSILIDEARTPLIISGPAPYSTEEYQRVKPLVHRLVRRQHDLCNDLIQETKSLLEQDDEEAIQLKLYQLHQGMPKHKQLLKMLEEPSVRRLMERINAAMLTDARKEQARELREALYFNIEEKERDAHLTEKGCTTLSPDDPEAYVLPDLIAVMSELDGNTTLNDEEKMEKRQAIQRQFSEKNERIHAVDQLIKAYCVYEKDVEYVVQDNQVIIVDEFTGRPMPGRRWSDGLHQAVEAKEGAKIEKETQTLATITIQNYFRKYEKLAGMTGTAETEADEFHQIYKLDVVVIPTNRPVRRVDYNDPIYKTKREKLNAVIDEIAECHEQGQPALVGTIAVETSELISRMLKRRNIPHSVLNAKQNASEAEIVARAGQKGAVTIATNMAGRGTDIKLGEGVVHIDREVLNSQIALSDKVNGTPLRKMLEERPCGLCVLGTERHESRRIDRQLRGRCARQGDPGASRFYVSLEDDLMRMFGSQRISGIMEKLGLEEGQVLEHSLLNRSIERAQRKVEQHNFSIRKRTLEYDDVMNKQREIIYGRRTEALNSKDVREHLYAFVEEIIYAHAAEAADPATDEALEEFVVWSNSTFPIGIQSTELQEVKQDAEALGDKVMKGVQQAYEIKAQNEDAESLESMERHIMLQAIDTHWQEYLRNMDALRQGVGLRAYGQRDPLVEYKREAYDMFAELMDLISHDIATNLFRSATSLEALQSFLSTLPQKYVHDEVSVLGKGAPAKRMGEDRQSSLQARGRGERVTVRRDTPKVSRNDPCPCGSGKKHKKCCGTG
ncbi:MAG: preprotein translocase subunit SecA [Kiritimatiellae bacterium]|nr:preprotein translocase subunit SecA [Kiritimatiellia bacterium]